MLLHGGTPKDLTMMDPFLGIGHAAEAAGELEIGKFIGFEIDEVYLEEAGRQLGA